MKKILKIIFTGLLVTIYPIHAAWLTMPSLGSGFFQPTEKIVNFSQENPYLLAGVAVVGLSLAGLYAKHKSQVMISEAQQEFEKFISMHEPPEDVIQEIEKAFRLEKIDKCVIGDSWIGFTERLCIKCGHDIRRVINAERVHKVIKDNNLTCLRVPKKYVYKIEGTWAVIAERIQKSENNTPITLEEIQQLIKFIELTGFADLNYQCPNIIRDNNTKLVFIDTEDRSFLLQRMHDLFLNRPLLKENMKYSMSGGIDLTPDVSRYIDSYEASASVRNITLRTDLDDAHRKIALVKRYRSYLEARNTISAIKNYLWNRILPTGVKNTARGALGLFKKSFA